MNFDITMRDVDNQLQRLENKTVTPEAASDIVDELKGISNQILEIIKGVEGNETPGHLNSIGATINRLEVVQASILLQTQIQRTD